MILGAFSQASERRGCRRSRAITREVMVAWTSEMAMEKETVEKLKTYVGG